MSLDSDDIPLSAKLSFRPGQIAVHVLRSSMLRNIFIACLVVALLFPLYHRLYLAPSYMAMLSSFSEDEARRVAAYLLRVLRIGERPLKEVTASAHFSAAIDEIKTDFQLEKLQLIDSSGLIVYSTLHSDVGITNENPHFTQIVAKGEIYSQVVITGGRSMENQPIERDVVEVYVPIMKDGSFLGAFEIYFNITAAKQTLGNLLRQSNMTLGFVALMMMIVVVIILFKAGEAMLTHSSMDKALQRAHDDLERRVQARAADLIRSNEDLQQEIRERRQAETALREAQKALLGNLKFMNTLIDTIPNPVFFKDAKGFFEGCNEAYAQIIGKPKKEIIGLRLIDFADNPFSEVAQKFHAQDMELILRPGIQSQDQHIRCADGVLRDYLIFKASFRDAEGHIAGLVGIMVDISALKKVEKELKESKNLFEAFMRHLPGLAFIKDLKGRYLFVNQAFVQFSGNEGPVLPGTTDEQVWDAETVRLLSANDQEVRRTQSTVNAVETVRLADGQERHLLTARFPIFQEKMLSALGGISIDITERTLDEHRRRQLELQLQQAQKMEALGTLAGGIAHDFNNILAAIIGYTEIAVADTPKESQLHTYLVRVLEAGERARSLVKQILTFSRQGEAEPKPVQVKIIVEEVLKLLRATLPVTIEVVQNIRSNAAVMADPVQIHQVMMNLCTNAGFAMREKGGRLTVDLEDVTLNDIISRRQSDLKPGNYVRLSVLDTGHGIAAEQRSRIFDPFFTTKPKGQGTGLGLSVVHGIVNNLGGTVTVDSTPGQGTRFDVYLPVIPGDPVVTVGEPQALLTGSETILFVDDEVFQTEMMTNMLKLLGYKVMVRNSGAEALKLFEKDPHAVDLVITDMIMPELTGDELSRRFLARRPDLPIILCTGYSENITEEKAKELGIKAFMLKPVVMEELSRQIRMVLDGD